VPFNAESGAPEKVEASCATAWPEEVPEASNPMICNCPALTSTKSNVAGASPSLKLSVPRPSAPTVYEPFVMMGLPTPPGAGSASSMTLVNLPVASAVKLPARKKWPAALLPDREKANWPANEDWVYPETSTFKAAVDEHVSMFGQSPADAVTVTIWPTGGVAGGRYTPFALIVPRFEFPPSMGSPPTGPTDQVTRPVVPPVSDPVKEIEFAVPDGAGRVQFAGGGAEGVALVEAFMQVVDGLV